MKQLSFLEEQPQKNEVTHWHLYVDGASRNNPGTAGAGFHLIKSGKTVLKKGFFIGTKTNNQAEYLALLIGLFFAHQNLEKNSHLSIFADSQLLVRQMNGEYKVKEPGLKPLQSLAYKLLNEFDYTLQHILRGENEVADEMANEGIDKKIKLPDQFITSLNSHEIYI